MKSPKFFPPSSFQVRPVNNPDVINTHMVQIDGKWVERPGTLAVIIGVTTEENVDKIIEDIFGEIFKNSKITSNPNLQTKIHDCKHKIYAVRYHLRTIKAEIDKRFNDFQKNYKAASGASFEQENPILIYEAESFLFQVKSNLDLIVQVLSHIVPSLKSFRTFAHSGTPGKSDYITGGKFIKTLEKASEKELQDIFETNRIEWIQEMTIWRDTITHYSKLKNFSCFIEEPYRGGDVVIHYPSMPNKERLDDYCNKIYERLIKLYQNLFRTIF
jgi:hypothetical protein